MRIELAGSLIQLEPLVLKFETEQNFEPADYINFGFTHFDVICIGAGGGRGGGIDTQNTGTQIRNYGGEGGGGGFHRVKGLLSLLPASCPVVVGAAGDPGTDDISNPANTTDGTDGGYSSFSDICQASGGEGGKRAQTNSDTVTTEADGGDGGIGNRIIAGGGGAGGTAGTPTVTGPGTPGTDGTDGTFSQNVGQGGGGGAGGVGKYVTQNPAITCNAATTGGKGSYNPIDLSVYGLGREPSDDSDSGAEDIVPGIAGGAKAAPLNSLPTVYGNSGNSGIVVIRFTAE
jgi:hypothetical protein